MSVTEIGEASQVSSDLQPLADGVAAGDYDLVAVGRALLTDPAWVEKVRAADFGSLKAFDKADLDRLW